MLEDQPKLGLGGLEALPGPDEERHAGPAPVLDLQPERGVGLGGRFGIDAVDVEVAVVLTANVVRGVGVGDGVEERDLGVLDHRGVIRREGISIADAATTCIRWLTTTSRSAPTGS